MPDICLVPFDRTYLDRSWEWLNDPEVKAMTLTPDFTRQQQHAFFEGLPSRTDYRIWGVATENGTPIGAAGLKRIAEGEGEIWCYIGERCWWGRGLGPKILALCEEQARKLNLGALMMVAAADNTRSIRAFEKSHFVRDPVGSDASLVTLRKVLR